MPQQHERIDVNKCLVFSRNTRIIPHHRTFTHVGLGRRSSQYFSQCRKACGGSAAFVSGSAFLGFGPHVCIDIRIDIRIDIGVDIGVDVDINAARSTARHC